MLSLDSPVPYYYYVELNIKQVRDTETFKKTELRKINVFVHIFPFHPLCNLTEIL